MCLYGWPCTLMLQVPSQEEQAFTSQWFQEEDETYFELP